MMKKCLSLVLALVMALALCSVSWADDKGTASNPYSLDEFNKLTEDISGTVYVDIGTISLASGSVIVGNDDLRDKYDRGEHAGADGIFDTTYTDKAGINLIILGGTIKDGPAVDNNAEHKIAFRIPNKSTVTFKGTKIEGFFGFSGATADNPYGTVMPHKIESVTFDGCTFDGPWLQNGGFATKEIKLTGCTFNKFENSASAGNTNPIWFKNIGQQGGTNVSIDNCVFNTNRPIKLAEEVVDGQAISITKCKFNMEPDAENKNVGIMFSTKGTLGNVRIEGNTISNGTSLISFYTEEYVPTMAEGATFTVSDNTLNGAQASVIWKQTTEFKPEFVTVTEPTPEKPSNNYYYYAPTTDTTETKGSPKTFDAGIALYVGMALTSAAGLAYTGKKRED